MKNDKVGVMGSEWLLGLVLSVAHINVWADLTLSAPPRENPERAEAMYGPLAELLSERFDRKVIYDHPKDWIEYVTKMKQKKYDIIFDGPHFAAWRIKHLEHLPVAKLPGKLSFVVIERAAHQNQRGLRDIVKGGMCAVASPNLGTMLVLAEFGNPLVLPDLYEVQDPRAVYDAFISGRCRGAVMQERFFNKLSAVERKGLRVVFTTPGFPDQTITVSKRLSQRQRNVLTTTLTERGLDATQELLAKYTKQADRFEVARLPEYQGLERLLEDVLWGW